jgi:threonine synthase
MKQEARYRCIECGDHYSITPDLMRCPGCAGRDVAVEPLHGILEVELPRLPGADTSRAYSFSFLEEEHYPSIPVGNTPLWRPERLREEDRFEKLFIKDDTANPTGSLKDRASYMVAAFARKHGIGRITVASTGNAASSMAGVGAAAGLEVRIFIPRSAPAAKRIQALQYGAEVILVDGTYDKAFDLALEESGEPGILCRNTGYNPLTIEGKKSVSIEIFSQLGKLPDYVFVPTGDGVILSGVYKGFRDLVGQGITAAVPTVVAVQAEGSSAVCRAFHGGEYTAPISSETLADSISVDVPRGGYPALYNLKRYGGRCVTVSDDEILESQHRLARLSGLFAEPAAAASYAGFRKIRREIPADASVVLLVTGSGLKDIDAAARIVG